MERLQRVLAMHGITSRRKAEAMIVEGRVSVDGVVVTELGTRVDPERQQIRVDGNLLKYERRRYLMLNKPPGYITTASDERGRRTVLDLVNVPERVVPVGRLDRQTSGLLLLTNDGDLLYRVTHPRFELEKEYEVLLDGFPPPEVLERLRSGIIVDGEKVIPEQVRPLRSEPAGTLLRIVIHEGRNRIVRRMMEQVGYPVLNLNRTRVGPIQVRGLALGAWRELTPGELGQLRDALRLTDEDIARTRPPAPRSKPTGAGDRRSGGGRRGSDRPGSGRPPGRGSGGKPSGGPNRPGRPARREGGTREGRPSDGRDRRAGGGGQEHRGQRGGPST